MASDHYSRLAKLFREACDLSAEEQGRFIEHNCSGDEDLKRELRALLDSDQGTAEFPVGPDLEQALRLGLAEGSERDPMESYTALFGPGGRFEFERVLGEGGMGVVLLARQKHPARRVAVKIIRSTMLIPEVVARFDHESRLLARLQHPGIAQIYETGTAGEGGGARPYFVMEYVAGRCLTGHVEALELGLDQLLELLAAICDAVHHAHQQGVVHRDLKPENILVTDEGQPKIVDFGVARATDSDIELVTQITKVGELLGTVRYMSPEQATGDVDAIDSRSDVYSLGVVGYELVAGHLPHSLEGVGLLDAVRIIQEDSPTRLGLVNTRWRGDVETIFAKALEKDKERRYASASELAADLRRFLRHEPLVARPPSTLYQLRRFTRRNRTLVVSLVALFVVLVASVIISSTLYFGADQARQEALFEKGVSARSAYMANMASASLTLESGDIAAARSHLDKTQPDLRHWEWRYLSSLCEESKAVLSGHTKRVYSVAYSPDGSTLASASWDGTLRVWDVESETCTQVIPAHDDRAYSVRFSPDGRSLLSASWDRTMRLYDTDTWESVRVFEGHERRVYRAEFSPDGEAIASVSGDETVRLWDVETGRQLWVSTEHDGEVYCVRFHKSGETLVSSSDGGLILIHDARTGEVLARLEDHLGFGVISVRYSPDGSKLASCGRDGMVRLYDLERGERLWEYTLSDLEPISLAFSPSGHRLYVGMVDSGQIQALATESARLEWTARSMGEALPELAMSPDGGSLASAAYDGNVRLWDADPVPDVVARQVSDKTIITIAFSPDGRRIAHAGDDLAIGIIDAITGEHLASLPGHRDRVYDLVFSVDGKLLASCSRDGGVRVSDARTGKPLWAFEEEDQVTDLVFLEKGSKLVYSVQGRLLVRTLSGSSTMRSIDELGPELGSGRAAVSLLGGRMLAVGTSTGVITLYDPETGERLNQIQAHDEMVTELCSDGAGRLLVSVGEDRSAHIWRIGEGGEVEDRFRISDVRSHIALSADGERLFVASANGISIFDPVSGDRTLNLSRVNRAVGSLAVSLDEESVAATTGTMLHVWSGRSRAARTAMWRGMRERQAEAQLLVSEGLRAGDTPEQIAARLVDDPALGEDLRQAIIRELLQSHASK